MTGKGASRLAWALFGLVVIELALGFVFGILLAQKTDKAVITLGELGFFLSFVLFPFIGVLLASRRPDNALGWLMLAIGIFAFEPISSYGDYAIATGRPGGALAVAIASWTWIPTVGLAGTFLLLLFPDGHLPSPRWRWFAWAIAIGMGLVAFAITLGSETLADNGHPNVANPLYAGGLKTVVDVLVVSIAVIPLGVLGSALSLVVRFRRADPTERLQIRWLASAATVVAVVFAFTMLASLIGASVGWAEEGTWLGALQTIAILLFALIPISIGVAVLKYRLYDIDVVIRKAVVAGAIAVFFTAVYVAIVGGVGALVESRSTAVLSFIAAAIVAALFQPVMRRAGRLADRIVYGKRATPYEVLSEFSERVGETFAAEDVLPRMARVVAEGVGARSARVWVERSGRLQVAASWPAETEIPVAVVLRDAGLPPLPDADAAFPVEHRGELLGALAVAMPPADPIDEPKAKLVSDLAAQAGLVLRNVRLTRELQARLEDLRAAQKRLVAAQDEARRRLERNIHDGAQQRLVALSVKLRLAQSLVAKDPAQTGQMLEQLQAETTETLEDLRDLARGIYPPLLADKGLVAALEAQARRSVVPVELHPDGAGRYPQEVEAAVYFSVLEALQNVSKYANADRAEVRLADSAGALTFQVRDDGVGFDASVVAHGTGLQGIADRLAALDGTVEVRSAPGEGTTVAGRIPLGADEREPALSGSGSPP
ncbi:MAG TPA: histidine kinase [Actinomycetota bacterium]|nr:histidine kinase [Actinomycetota bacterium]